MPSASTLKQTEQEEPWPEVRRWTLLCKRGETVSVKVMTERSYFFAFDMFYFYHV